MPKCRNASLMSGSLSGGQGNTPLHETFLTDVEEELLKLGANVNARNNDGAPPSSPQWITMRFRYSFSMELISLSAIRRVKL